ncbi:hypothetical protein HYFRA_00007267 [Hymenoscyphus fraxineus]|uniref:AAA+ ATPase domain-containing protein n=1 Tax=Hymenoscyphus fraxineus TaxID=746836 RepID=A0A9N9KQ68_9HELO|nr:hypothetical protein HYFRA_00007267 [Hymenoscyphus fraxineus]
MAEQISAFRMEVSDLGPILTPQKRSNADLPKSFKNQDSYNSGISSETLPSATDTPASSMSGAETPVIEKVADAQIAPKNVNVKYSLEVFDDSKTEWSRVTQHDEAFDLSQVTRGEKKENSPKQISPMVFEIITQANGYDKRTRKFNPEGATENAPAPPSAVEPELPPLKLNDLMVTEIIETRMEIHSDHLIDVIREVVDYYPSQNLAGDIVIIQEPYWVLLHHEKELRKVETRLSSVANISDDEKAQAEHLHILLEFIRPHLERIVPPIERRLQKKVPTVTFEALWYLLKPGTLAYCQFDGHWIGCVIMHLKNKFKQGEKKVDRLNVRVWFLDFFLNKLNRAWTRSDRDPSRKTKHAIQQFDGEENVTNLQIIPRKYWDAIDKGAKRKSFEARGLKKITMLQKGHQQMAHDGMSLEKERRVYDGSVIVDDLQNIQVSYTIDHVWTFPASGVADLLDDKWIRKVESDSTSLISKLAKLLEMENNDPKNLTKDQCFLMSPDVPCFALDNKSWMSTHIDCLHEIEESTAPTKLVMEETHLKLIKSLADSQTSSKSAWAADSIKNKGKGVIILLHGPPGVGKTYSVECTAVATKRPLLALTIADIGTKEDSIESELTSWFYLAERWKAVLLIDEADIFLERRKHTDLARNGIVSAFLRKMEYFSGLLFLTTNRVGHIDEAFMSRVHVVIGFPQLDDIKRREIWQGFLDKMKTETGGKIRLTASAKTYIMQSWEDLNIKLNGREIRNALQTAIALAEFEAKEDSDYSEDEVIKVEKDHFERVLSMSRSFRTYLDSIKSDTVEKRAQNLYGRNDYDEVSDDHLGR